MDSTLARTRFHLHFWMFEKVSRKWESARLRESDSGWGKWTAGVGSEGGK